MTLKQVILIIAYVLLRVCGIIVFTQSGNIVTLMQIRGVTTSDVIILMHASLCIFVWTAQKHGEKFQWSWILFVAMVGVIFYVNASISLYSTAEGRAIGFRIVGFGIGILPVVLVLLKRALKEMNRKSKESHGR